MRPHCPCCNDSLRWRRHLVFGPSKVMYSYSSYEILSPKMIILLYIGDNSISKQNTSHSVKLPCTAGGHPASPGPSAAWLEDCGYQRLAATYLLKISWRRSWQRRSAQHAKGPCIPTSINLGRKATYMGTPMHRQDVLYRHLSTMRRPKK